MKFNKPAKRKMIIKLIESLELGYYKGEDGKFYLFERNEQNEEFIFADEKDSNNYYKVTNIWYNDNDEITNVEVEALPYTMERAQLA